MNRIIYVDPEIIDILKIAPSPNPDPELAAAVGSALKKLEPELTEIIRERVYEGRKISEIALNLNKSEKDIIALLYEAKRQLKILLADFVKQRWGIETKGNCRICAHASREIIENILTIKKENDSWRQITAKIQEATGERFHPPQILKAHLKHIKRGE